VQIPHPDAYSIGFSRGVFGTKLKWANFKGHAEENQDIY